MQIRLKRAYEKAGAQDGIRILVDRLWPRGVSKSDAAIDAWMKEIAPSTGLRKWFGHDPSRWEEFVRRYRAELDAHRDVIAEMQEYVRKGRVTLVYGARDETHNHARVLKQYLEEKT